MSDHIHVIGAGIAGMGAAHRLAAQGQDAIVWEAGDKPGGRAGYALWNGECLEYGGKNYASNWINFMALADEFGLTERDRQHPNFHIVLNDRLIGLEKKQSLGAAIGMLRNVGVIGTVEFHRLMRTAKRLAGELNYADGVIEEIERRYDDRPVSKLFHRNLADGPLRMFSIIMGGAEPDETYLSQVMLFLSGFGKGSHHSVPGGLVRLFDGLAAGKEMRFGARITRIELDRGRVAALHLTEGGKTHRVRARQVISTLPLNLLLQVLDLPAEIRAEAERIRYFPLALINAIYDRDVFTENMNSIMFAPGSILGHCSANRMYQRNRVRFTLSGREARKVLHLSDETLIELAEREFRRFHPIEGARVHYHVQRHMGGICAYAPNFTTVRRRLMDHVATIEGLEIAGDYLDGHNMEGCLTSAMSAVERITGEDARPRMQMVA